LRGDLVILLIFLGLQTLLLSHAIIDIGATREEPSVKFPTSLSLSLSLLQVTHPMHILFAILIKGTILMEPFFHFFAYFNTSMMKRIP
jgi:hypothetical protein